MKGQKKMNIGEIILKNRKRLNLTQDALAVKLGISNQSVSKWESDKCCPDIELLPQLADIFEISIDELLGYRPSKSEIIRGLPFKDDNVLRIVAFEGNKLIKFTNKTELKLVFEGEVLDVQSDFDIICGDIKGDATAGGDITCGKIDGNVRAEGDIACTDVRGDITCGGNVGCFIVNGNIKANGEVACAENNSENFK